MEVCLWECVGGGGVLMCGEGVRVCSNIIIIIIIIIIIPVYLKLQP